MALQQSAAADENIAVDRVAAFSLPSSSYLSPAAQRACVQNRHDLSLVDPSRGTEQYRQQMDAYFYRPRYERARAMWPVVIESRSYGRARADVVTPAAGIAAHTRDHVLINLHGGGFRIGAGLGALIEAIPFAARGRIKVVTIDYRQGPEHTFPAASEDVAEVYQRLLETYRPENIGIYGTSAGGVLAAMAIAWFREHHLPIPGAIGLFCAAASNCFGGDARFVAPALMGQRPPPPKPNPPLTEMAYMGGADINDPLVSPVGYPELLKAFPPSILMTGTRDFALSAAVHSHGQLVKAGVSSELHVWDGLWHGFLYDTDLPEIRDACDVALAFFAKHLGAQK